MLEDSTCKYVFKVIEKSVWQPLVSIGGVRVDVSGLLLVVAYSRHIWFGFSCSCCNLTVSIHKLLDCNTLCHFHILQWASRLSS